MQLFRSSTDTARNFFTSHKLRAS